MESANERILHSRGLWPAGFDSVLFVLILVIELKVMISVVRQGAWLASWFARKWEQQCGDQGNLVADLSLGEFQIGLLPNKMFWSKKVETFSTCSNY